MNQSQDTYYKNQQINIFFTLQHSNVQTKCPLNISIQTYNVEFQRPGLLESQQITVSRLGLVDVVSHARLFFISETVTIGQRLRTTRVQRSFGVWYDGQETAICTAIWVFTIKAVTELVLLFATLDITGRWRWN